LSQKICDDSSDCLALDLAQRISAVEISVRNVERVVEKDKSDSEDRRKLVDDRFDSNSVRITKLEAEVSQSVIDRHALREQVDSHEQIIQGTALIRAVLVLIGSFLGSIAAALIAHHFSK
jgi:hypothetical protein